MSDEDVQPVANFVRVIFEGPLPIRAFFECLHCDEPLMVNKQKHGWGCFPCGTFTPHDQLANHLQQCVDAMKGK